MSKNLETESLVCVVKKYQISFESGILPCLSQGLEVEKKYNAIQKGRVSEEGLVAGSVLSIVWELRSVGSDAKRNAGKFDTAQLIWSTWCLSIFHSSELQYNIKKDFGVLSTCKYGMLQCVEVCCSVSVYWIGFQYCYAVP